jgi:tetratricopeptide (TPR) repeat protein
MWRAFLLAALVVPTSAFGQENSGWIGKRVITHYGAVLQIGNQVVDDEERSTNLAISGKARSILRVYRVEHVNGNWLWLKAENRGVEGWVKAEFVIPYDQAVDYFTNQIRANPNEGQWYNYRGTVWGLRGEYEIAIADFNEAIRLDPGNEDAFNNRGIARRHKNDFDKAIADHNEAIRLNPKYSLAFRGRGLVWSQKKDYENAIADYSEAIRLDPKYAAAFIGRGWVWLQKKEYDKAIADDDEAIRLDPKYALAFSNRGIARCNKKEYDKAIVDYSEAIRIDPNFASAYNSLAWLWATCPERKYRDGKKAVESATRACELSEWKNAYRLETLAAAYAEAGDFDKAVEWQEKAIKFYADADARKKGEERLRLYKDKKPFRDKD